MGYMSKEEFNLRMNKIKSENEQIELREKLKKEKNKFRRSKKNKTKTANIILTAAIIAIISYTIACLYVQYKTGTAVDSTLSTLWYSFWTVEVVVLAGIKVTKVIKNYKSESNVEPIDSNENSVG